MSAVKWHRNASSKCSLSTFVSIRNTLVDFRNFKWFFQFDYLWSALSPFQLSQFLSTGDSCWNNLENLSHERPRARLKPQKSIKFSIQILLHNCLTTWISAHCLLMRKSAKISFKLHCIMFLSANTNLYTKVLTSRLMIDNESYDVNGARISNLL